MAATRYGPPASAAGCPGAVISPGLAVIPKVKSPQGPNDCRPVLHAPPCTHKEWRDKSQGEGVGPCRFW